MALSSENEFTCDQTAPDLVRRYLRGAALSPLFLHGNALDVLTSLPQDSVDCCMTSPPYWGHRQYAEDGIGLEDEHVAYVHSLVAILNRVGRVLKPSGSLWLNIGDTYENKHLVGVPWRVALSLIDEHGWILRNDVIWHKVKGAQTAP